MGSDDSGSDGEPFTRRKLIALLGTSTVAAIAGCSSDSDSSSNSTTGGTSLGSSTASGSSTDSATDTGTETGSSTDSGTDTESESSTSTGEVEKSSSDEITALVDTITTFRSSLSDDVLSDATYSVENEEEFSWTNLPPALTGDRGGVPFSDLSDDQIDSFYDVVDSWMSDAGSEKVNFITQKAEAWLENKNSDEWSVEDYHVAMFGDPSSDAIWGYQLDGHHLALNFVVYGDQATVVPNLIGSEPVTLDGNSVFDGERNLAFKLMNSLSDSQQSTAIQDGSGGIQAGPAGSSSIGGGGGNATNGSAPGNMTMGNGSMPSNGTMGNGTNATNATNGSVPGFGGNSSSNNSSSNASGSSGMGNQSTLDASRDFDFSQFDGVGLKASKLNSSQKKKLRNLIKEYVYNLDEDLAADWMSDINDSLGETYFAWIGEVSQDEPIYYRVYNPHVWIEYNNEAGNGTSGDLNHVHTVTRSPDDDRSYGGLSYSSSSSSSLLAHYLSSDHHSLGDSPVDYIF